MDLEEPGTFGQGQMVDLEEMEVDPWAGLIQPDTVFSENPAEGGRPKPKRQVLKDLRTKLGWVVDELNRRKRKLQPTKRQSNNLRRLQRAYSRLLGRGRTLSRGLNALREYLQSLIRIKSLQERKAAKKEREKELKYRMVSRGILPLHTGKRVMPPK